MGNRTSDNRFNGPSPKLASHHSGSNRTSTQTRYTSNTEPSRPVAAGPVAFTHDTAAGAVAPSESSPRARHPATPHFAPALGSRTARTSLRRVARQGPPQGLKRQDSRFAPGSTARRGNPGELTRPRSGPRDRANVLCDLSGRDRIASRSRMPIPLDEE